jgi:subtilase family serine protease
MAIRSLVMLFRARHSPLTLLISIAVCALAASGAWGGGALRSLAGHVPTAVAHLRPLGDLPPDYELTLALGLPLRHTNELARLLDELYDPASANYHRYLTPAQFTERFGPTAADYQAVIAFAQTNGLEITEQQDDRHVLHVKAAAARVAQTFHGVLRTYQHPTENREFYAPDSAPAIPADLPIADIWGLSDYPSPHPLHVRQPRPSAMDPPQPNYGSGPGYTLWGYDFRRAYAPGVTLTGAGQTIGLFQADGFYASDITNYVTQSGLPGVPPMQIVLLDGFKGSPGNNNAEVALDIELAIAMAPGISKLIVYEDNPRRFNPNTVLKRMASDNACRQISSSWSWSGGPNTTTDSYLQQLAAQGTSYFQASGDDDAYLYGAMDNSTNLTTPVSSPYLTCVGGTTLAMSGSGVAYSSETVWNWNTSGNPGVGSGGGISSNYTIPTWQTGVSMANNHGSATKRNLPDVALTADNIYVIWNNGSNSTFGGTSCAAPIWAGVCALVNQQASSLGHANVGFLNPALYAIGTGTTYSARFHDITSGNNFSPTSPTNFSAVAGYDLCTGWGTPNGSNMINALAPPFPLTITANNTNKIYGQPIVFSGREFSATGLINGDMVTNVALSSVGAAADAAVAGSPYPIVISNASGIGLSRYAITYVNGWLTVRAPKQTLLMRR